MIYDNIVVGAGSAGCVVASRLSEDPNRNVLLIEAGGSNRRLDVRAPAAFSAQFHSKVDWDYFCEPEEGLDGRSLHEPRAKMMGGCSSMNAMLYIRGNRIDYEDWVEKGAKGWSYDEVLPHFVKSENNKRINDRCHGTRGPLDVTAIPSPDQLAAEFISAAQASGIASNDDFNGAEQDGVGMPQVTQRNGTRWDTATAFITPARKRANLTVLTGALVHRVIVEGGRAVGVELSSKGKTTTVRASGDIVVSGGAFGTVEILQRSGIGPADHLRSLGIAPVVDLPAVGANLMEHPLIGVYFELTGAARGMFDVPGPFDAPKPKYLYQWLRHKTGPLSSNVAEAIAHVRSDSSLPAPDLQLLMIPGYFYGDGTTKHPVPAFTLGASMIAPKSRGSVMIRSSDPRRKAAVKLNFFDDPDDLQAMVRSIRILREIATTAPLSSHVAREFLPGPELTDDASLSDFVRREVLHTFHPSCTARIGGPDDGAVDPELRVYGVDGLRVADTSVFPTIIRGNTNAPAIMVGERCADFIRNPSA
ncbi:GMC family oxidoreductase [Antrihabitans cavernicola]|uniref:Glucose-methanol-choline oxidoreductase n=1 Tax=Antrihabitans cavernicola TaxID=2495913 RepID=A0A5A7SF53_9NOCA|nr:GMC family oxidoreductase N-terminal domain-containing protein [Spelaeibacter cavernicola]KAA0024214.1 glucose-methanol-choline oxidoreductase [Spelaeibacter cavernicola]